MLLFLAGSRELNCSQRSPSSTHCSEGVGERGLRETGREGTEGELTEGEYEGGD